MTRLVVTVAMIGVLSIVVTAFAGDRTDPLVRQRMLV